jgi:glycosyltransferase involved in cell wall biosynthesis
MLDLLENLPLDHFTPLVLLPYSGEFNKRLSSLGIKTAVLSYLWWIPTRSFYKKYYLIKYFLKLIPSIFRIINLIKSNKIQVVYTNTVTVLDGAIASKICGIPHIWHIRESVDGNNQLVSSVSNHLAFRVIYFFSDSIIFNSKYLRNLYSIHNSSKIKVIHNGVIYDKKNVIHRRNISKLDVVKLTTIGYVEYRKGLDILLDALIFIADLGYKFSLTVAGDVDKAYFDSEIYSRLKNQKLTNSVIMAGWIPNVNSILNESDILVSSARQEPFGRTIIEAMSLGIPVISTKSGGPCEIINNGIDGILVDQNPSSMAEALMNLIDNSELLNSISCNSIKSVEANFSIKAYVSNLTDEITRAANLRAFTK